MPSCSRWSRPEEAIRRRLAEAEARRRGLLLGAPAGALTFREFVARVHPRYRWYRHCEVLGGVLQRVADGEITRCMIFEPPRHGKSETVSRLFSAYYLHRYPERWVGVNCFGADLAFTLSRGARDFYLRAGGPVRDDAAAVRHWETGKGGGMWAAGVGGPITGKGFHLGIVDDPLKNAQEAESAVTRGVQKDWYRSTFSTREEPGGAVVVVQTRWHPDDLAGWLLEEESGDDPERWHVVSLPAIATGEPPAVPETCTVEADWREAGEALCPERYPIERLEQRRSRLGPYFFGALYQQNPRARSGGMFQRQWFPVVDAAPEGMRRVRFWDLAATKPAPGKDPDYTVGCLMGRRDGEFVVLDVVRMRDNPTQVQRLVVQTAQLDGPAVQVRMEQEPGSAGKAVIDAYTRALVGYSFRGVPSTGDKTLRADPFSAQAGAGNVRLLRGGWNREFLEELEAFPQGAHDDQLDAASGAFSVLAGSGYVETPYDVAAPYQSELTVDPWAERRW